jgi:hypothetical protein
MPGGRLIIAHTIRRKRASIKLGPTLSMGHGAGHDSGGLRGSRGACMNPKIMAPVWHDLATAHPLRFGNQHPIMVSYGQGRIRITALANP